MLPSLQALRTRIFSGKRYEQSSSGVTVYDTPGESSRWILSRSLCTYHKIDLTAVDKSRRDAALANQVELLSPFTNVGYAPFWQDGVAQTWMWDESQQAAEQAEKQASVSEQADILQVLPESVFSKKHDDGVVVYSAMDGFVAQHWKNGVLQQEYFWEKEPGEAAWLRFLRSQGQPARPWQAPTDSFDIKGTPWAEARRNNLSLYEPRAFVGVVLVLVFLLAFQVFSVIGMTINNWNLNRQVENLKVEVAPALIERDAAFEALERNRQLETLGSISQARYMLDLMEALPKGDDQGEGLVRRWRYQDGDIELLVNVKEPDLEAFATAIDSLDLFTDVQLTPNDRTETLVVKLKVANL